MVALGQVVADAETTDHAGDLLGGVLVGQQLAHHLPHRVHGLVTEVEPGRRAGVADQLTADGTAFGVVGVEQVAGGPAPDHRRQLPAQVRRVLQSGTQAPRGQRRDLVRGVARQQHPAAPVLLRQRGGVARGPQPQAPGVVDRLARQPPPRGGDLGEGQCARLRAGGQLGIVNDHPAAALAQRGAHHHPPAGQPFADRPGARGDAGDLRGVHAAGGLPVGDGDAGQLADRTAGAVAADDVPGALLAGAVGAREGDHDTVGGLAQAGHLAATVHRHAQLGQPAAERPLGPGLGQAQHPAVVLVQHVQVEADAAEVAHRAPPEGAQAGQQPALVQRLRGPPVEAERPGFLGGGASSRS
ncbi:hypothetical protein GCM10020256_00890 [Streptomyces thermocoprophilus]